MEIDFYRKMVLAFVFLWFQNGFGSGGALTYIVTHPTADDGTSTQMDLFLASAYPVLVEIDGAVESLSSYSVYNKTTSAQRSDEGINITTHDSYTVVATKGHKAFFNMDGYRPLPISRLGNDYTISAWAPSSNGYSFIVLTATGRDVNITVKIPAWFAQPVEWQGITYTRGTEFTVSLESNSSVQLNFTGDDPTGIHLWTEEDKNFSVLSGSMVAAINGSLPGIMYDVMPPYNLTGNFYIGVPITGRQRHIWRLVATTNDTAVESMMGQGGVGDESTLLSKGEHYDFNTNSSTSILIYSSLPVMVTLITPSDDATPPTMASWCPMNLWKSYYVIVPLESSAVATEYVTITIERASSDGLRVMSSDGVINNITGWMTFDPLVFTFHYVSVSVSGVMLLWHVSDAPFQVIQSSFSAGWAYTLSAGCDLGLGTPTTASIFSSTSAANTATPSVTNVPSMMPTSVTTGTFNVTANDSASSTVATFSSTSAPTLVLSSSSSSGPSFLPNWMDEEEEWMIAAGAVSGAIVLTVSILVIMAVKRKHTQTYRISTLTRVSSTRHTSVTTIERSRHRKVSRRKQLDQSSTKTSVLQNTNVKTSHTELEGSDQTCSVLSSPCLNELKRSRLLHRLSEEGSSPGGSEHVTMTAVEIV